MTRETTLKTVENQDPSPGSQKSQRSNVINARTWDISKENVQKRLKQLGEKKSDSGDASVASEGYDSTKFLIHSVAKTKKEWILDSGCLFHMSPNKDWFLDLDEKEAGIVLLGNKKACRINGIGFMEIIMYDDYGRILRNVRYVLELRRNFVSLGMLHSVGCTVKIENDFMKIVKGAMTVMKRKLTNGLYTLIGETVIGTVAAIFENGRTR